MPMTKTVSFNAHLGDPISNWTKLYRYVWYADFYRMQLDTCRMTSIHVKVYIGIMQLYIGNIGIMYKE